MTIVDRVVAEDKLTQAAVLILEALGRSMDEEGILDTPRRFREAFLDDFAPNGDPAEVLAKMTMEETFDQMVIVRNIPVRSFCEHHILPWYGKAVVGYIPHEKTVGLSKITRMVSAAAKGLTIQERVTDEVANAMNKVLKPKGVMVVMDAVHSCTLLRGVKTEAQTFVTSATRGVFLTNPAPRTEFLQLVRGL